MPFCKIDKRLRRERGRRSASDAECRPCHVLREVKIESVFKKSILQDIVQAMKPESKYRLKVGGAAIFLVLIVDITLFFLAENSVISHNTNLIAAYTWNIIVLIIVLYLVNRKPEEKPQQSSH